MSQEIKYTCDRCRYSTNYNSGWVQTSKGYAQRDYCPSCVNALIILGVDAEERKPKLEAESEEP